MTCSYEGLFFTKKEAYIEHNLGQDDDLRAGVNDLGGNEQANPHHQEAERQPQAPYAGQPSYSIILYRINNKWKLK